MITLNRLGHTDEPFQLNVDMIVTVESTPDTVITLATGTKVVVGDAFRRRGAPQRAAVAAPAPAPAARDAPRLAAVEDEHT